MSTTFIPRAVFPTLQNLPRSYYLGHHAKGLAQMKSLMSSVDLVIEVRDARVPRTSRNPMFEELLGKGSQSGLGSKPRLILFTKRDLVEGTSKIETLLRTHHAPDQCMFISNESKRDIKSVLAFAKQFTSGVPASQPAATPRNAGLPELTTQSITGTRLMVVGMPNVGKSTLLNALRNVSLGKGKAAKTGDQPGVTRKVSSAVKILDGDSATNTQPVYLVDTPGVFVPYVPDAEAMLKLSLCGSVKDSIIPYGTLADYALYRVNLHDPTVYQRYSQPTNDVMMLLDGVAKGTGMLQKGGIPDVEKAALWFVQQWRIGKLGKFMLDDVSAEKEESERVVSATQAVRQERLRRKTTLNSTS